MKTEIIHISEKTEFGNSVRSVISFNKFIIYLKEQVASAKNLKTPYFKWILKKFEKLPELTGTVDIDQLGQYDEILELVSTCLLPLASDENTLWALCSALSPDIFYGTEGFYELLKTIKHPSVMNPETEDADTESEKIVQELQYGQVLEKIYDIPYLQKSEWVRKFTDPVTGLDKYYLIKIDSRFVDIRTIDSQPILDCSAILPSSVWGEEFKKIKRMLPLSRFEASGFGILSLSDVTPQQAVEQISKLIINNPEADMSILFNEISHSLRTIAGSTHYQFGIVPFLKINDRPALLYENFSFSVIVKTCWEYDVPKKEFNRLREDFVKNPRTIVWSAGDKGKELPPSIADAFIRAGIGTYIVFPVYHNNELTGLFEISTQKEQPMMSEGQLVKLKPALPLISQLIQNLIARFNANIENIIKEKFTSIQPAVQWKFNETAWHYLRDHVVEEKDEPIETIVFSNLHPLYGAVDIRNSTTLRNQALEQDYTTQLKLLIKTISSLDFRSNACLGRILDSSNNWLQLIREPLTTQQEIRLNEFLALDVQYEIAQLDQTIPKIRDTVEPYLSAVDEESGIAFKNRRILETAIRTMNDTVNNFYESAAVELQEIYPCYFEKFRTDGVEYDIYVGQSIAPKKPFLNEHLQKMRLWQLESMVQVAKLTQQFASSSEFSLQTTQMIFVHPQTIEITFRKDERRFDVEGAYNIRYHIIKKRIDKVLLRDQNERLTQPGKIAIVYFDERDAAEYRGFIRQMQNRDMLFDDLEELELESLQGVDGLKALRVGINVHQLRIAETYSG